MGFISLDKPYLLSQLCNSPLEAAYQREVYKIIDKGGSVQEKSLMK